MKEISNAVASYLETALWSTTGHENDCENLDDKYDFSNVSDEFKEQAQKDIDKLMELISHLLTDEEIERGHIEHDFWLTRNGHGAGFWDGDYIKGEQITNIVNKHFKQNDDDLREAISET